LSYGRSPIAAALAARSVVAALLGAFVVGALVGCSSGGAAILRPPPTSDGGPVTPVRALTLIDGSAARTVLFGESLSFAVRYAEADGRAVIGEEVAFAMVGVAHDSSLAQTAAVTDRDGKAPGVLLAGRTRASFRVRVSAVGAAPAMFDVAIGDAGFGALRAEVRYAGARTLSARVVAIYGGASCDETITAAVPDREQRLVELDAAARFVALPAGLRYAVVARGESESGALLTRGCVDEVLIENGGEAITVASMVDVAVTAAGGYDVALDVRALAAGDALRDATALVVSGFELAGGDASMVLDVIALDVADRDPVAADALRAARTVESLDGALSSALDRAGTRPSAALSALADVAATGLADLRVTGVLELGASGTAAPDGFAGVRIWSLGLGVDPIEVMAVGPTGTPTARVAAGFSPSRSTLVFEALDLRVWLGSTAAALLASVPATRGASGDLAALVAEQGGCDAVVRWAAATPAVADVCGDSCVRAACASTSMTLVSTLADVLVTLDAERDLLHLEGAVMGMDTDADTELDAIGPGDLAGSWSSATSATSDVVTATLNASRR